jgi:hypothetical protein
MTDVEAFVRSCRVGHGVQGRREETHLFMGVETYSTVPSGSGSYGIRMYITRSG